jgi:hypothetical protein
MPSTPSQLMVPHRSVHISHILLWFAGQVSARQACGVGGFDCGQETGGSRRPPGPPERETALATAISKELGPAVPLCPVAASTVYSKEVQRRKFSWNTFDERLDCGFGKTRKCTRESDRIDRARDGRSLVGFHELRKDY